MVTIKCPNNECGAVNPKTNDVCETCGTPLYRKVSYETAINVTIVLDIIFTVIYIVGIPLFISIPKPFVDPGGLIATLPQEGSFLYGFAIALFGFYAIVRILFLLNHFVFKRQEFVILREVAMYLESFTMFPIQFILAMYFYNPALRGKHKDVMRNGFWFGVWALMIPLLFVMLGAVVTGSYSPFTHSFTLGLNAESFRFVMYAMTPVSLIVCIVFFIMFFVVSTDIFTAKAPLPVKAIAGTEAAIFVILAAFKHVLPLLTLANIAQVVVAVGILLVVTRYQWRRLQDARTAYREAVKEGA